MKSRVKNRRSLSELTPELVNERIAEGKCGEEIAREFGISTWKLQEHLTKTYGSEVTVVLISKLRKLDEINDELPKEPFRKEKPKPPAPFLWPMVTPKDPHLDVDLSSSIMYGFDTAPKVEEEDDDLREETDRQVLMLRDVERRYQEELDDALLEETKTIERLQVRFQELLSGRDILRQKSADSAALINALHAERSTLDERIKRTEENIGWGLPNAIGNARHEAERQLARMEKFSGKRRTQAEVRYAELQTRVKSAESDLMDAKLKLVRLKSRLEEAEKELRRRNEAAKIIDEDIDFYDDRIEKTAAEINRLKRPHFYVKRFDEGVVVVCHHYDGFDEVFDSAPSASTTRSANLWGDRLNEVAFERGEEIPIDVYMSAARILMVATKLKPDEYVISYDEESDVGELKGLVDMFIGDKRI